MKGKPQIHFWTEPVEINAARGLPSVYAVNCCRAWDLPSNGVFLLLTSDEIKREWQPKLGYVSKVDWQGLLTKKLEARERALVDWYGRQAKHHLGQMELTPAEKRQRTAAREPDTFM